MTEEQIIAALFASLQGIPGFKTIQRRLKLWDDVSPTARPALFLYQRDTEYVAQEFTPPKVTLNADVFIYTRATDSGTPATQLNAMIAVVRAAFVPNPITGLFTLGGLVAHCWIEGKTIFEPGDLDNDGLAVLPIKILVPTLF